MKKGLTVVEVAVSLAVLALGVFPLVHQWTAGAQAIVVAMNWTEATMVAERAIEKLQGLPYSELQTGARPWETEGRFRYRVQILPTYLNAREVRVFVTWTEMERPVSWTMTSMIAKDFP